jgi:hypothetical protein
MKKLLLIGLLIVGCATKQESISMNIIDGNISSESTTLHTDDIKEKCKVECKELTLSSDEWCDCMNQCSQKVIDKISFGDMNVKIYIEECP